MCEDNVSSVISNVETRRRGGVFGEDKGESLPSHSLFHCIKVASSKSSVNPHHLATYISVNACINYSNLPFSFLEWRC